MNTFKKQKKLGQSPTNQKTYLMKLTFSDGQPFQNRQCGIQLIILMQ